MTYVPNAILFDGVADFMDRSSPGLVGAVDNKFLLVSQWIFQNGNDLAAATYANISDVSVVVQVRHPNTNSFQVNAQPNLNVGSSSGSISTSTGWTHLLASFDMGNVANRHLYVDDVSDLATITAYIDGNIDWTGTDAHIGSNQIGTTLLDGVISDFYMTNEYLDLSIVANRRKFITADLQPVYLGDNGELPTGTAALMYMRGNSPDQGVNSGSGGDFSENGSFEPGEAQGPVALTPPQEVILARRAGRYHRYFRG